MGLARTLYVHHIFGAFPAKTIVYTPYIHRVGQIRIRIIIRIIRYGIYAIFSSLPPLYLNFVFPYIRIYTAYIRQYTAYFRIYALFLPYLFGQF